MNCALCHETKDLCKSHIIPEFIFAPLYDKDHRFIEVTDVANGVVKRGQKGYWERLLCVDCEAAISRHERHSRRLFVDPLPPQISGSKRIREHPRLDYTAFKLFCLSILWRASVSSLAIFGHVKLGPHEEVIRQILLTGNAGDTLLYPLQIYALHFNGDPLRDFLVEPTHMRVDGHLCYRFVFMGFIIFAFVSSHGIPKTAEKLVIRHDGVIQTFDAELREFAFLRHVWDTVRETTKDK
ncbi:MAG: hypothetical protein KDK97_09530 [Verrucomicrobiales bacterium]|nr:hypothetical protein [Verrucomicrobiales bacterium]MCP5557448.1 hypothetical protein [Verrucomicrobiaceae bacterium]